MEIKLETLRLKKDEAKWAAVKAKRENSTFILLENGTRPFKGGERKEENQTEDEYLRLTTDGSPPPPGSYKKQEEWYQTWPENPEPSSEARKSW